MDTTIAFMAGEDWREWPEGEALLRDALADRGIDSTREVWSDGIEELSEYDALLIRSCWDYHKRPKAFRRWLDRLDDVEATIFNPPEVLRWNMNKQYLRDLDEAGLPVIPSEFFPAESDRDVGEVLKQRGWDDVVIKPLVGASGHEMMKCHRSELSDKTEELQQLDKQEGFFVQPFLERIQSEGEWSFVFFGGEYQYAIHKQPGDDDFRAHNHRGGTYRHAEPDPAWIEHVEELVDRFPHDCLYQRMDGVIEEDRLTIMEVEALEPSFYFTHYPSGAEVLAEKLASRL